MCPLLFSIQRQLYGVSIAIHAIIVQLQSSLNCWFLDDGTLAGDPATVEADLRLITEEGLKVGLQLNASKCEYSAHNYEVSGGSPLFTCKPVSFTDLTLLGSALGDHAESNCLAPKIEALERFACTLKLLQPHQAFFLLKNAMALPRLTYLLRTTNLVNQPLLGKYDAVIRCTLENLLNISLSDIQWKQASLPVKHGGLGVRSAVDVALPAFISSTMQSRDLCHEIAVIESVLGSNSAQSLWLSRVGLAVAPDSAAQGAWDLPLIEKAKNIILLSARDEADRARMLASTAAMSGDWLEALPAPSLGLMLSESELRISVSLRL